MSAYCDYEENDETMTLGNVSLSCCSEHIGSLHSAVSIGDVSTIDQLIRKENVDINSEDCHRRTPLMIAVLSQGASREIVQMLLDAGADHRSIGRKLDITKHPDKMEVFLWQPDINIKYWADAQGRTPLMRAAQYGRLRAIRVLLSSPVYTTGTLNMNAVDKISGMTALHRSADRGDTDIVHILLCAGAISDVRDKDGATPLCLAVNSEHTNSVKLLIRVTGRIDTNYKKLVVMSWERRYHAILKCLMVTVLASRVLCLPQVVIKDQNIRDIVAKTITLKHYCRVHIRHHMKYVVVENVRRLGIPDSLQDYLCFKQELI